MLVSGQFVITQAPIYKDDEGQDRIHITAEPEVHFTLN